MKYFTDTSYPAFIRVTLGRVVDRQYILKVNYFVYSVGRVEMVLVTTRAISPLSI